MDKNAPDLKNLSLRQKAELLTGKDFWSTCSVEDCGIKSFKFADGPHGLRAQQGSGDNFGLNASQKATCFPESSLSACSWDPQLLYGVGKRLGVEAAYMGVNCLLGPAVNIKRNPLNGRNCEYFSEDEYLTGALASEYIKGVQSGGVSACVKHYAANNREFARSVCDSVVSERALREVYLAPFEDCVKEGNVGAVMTAYNLVNGTPCSCNKYLISDILRGEWGFNGIVVSDWVGTFNRVEGVKAGEDVEMPRCPFSVEEIMAAVQDGSLKESEIDDCVKRIAEFSVKWRAGKTDCDFEEHAAYAQKCAEESIVLLKNNGILPLKKGEKIGVAGALAFKPHTQGGGSARVNAVKQCDFIGALKSKFNVTAGTEGYSRSGKYSKKKINRALKELKGVNTVVCFVGTTELQDSEGADKSGISLPQCQVELIEELVKAGKKVVAVLSCGSAVTCGWDSGVCALVYLGLSGQGGDNALARILCGEVNPSGKLAETFPQNAEDTPCARSFGKNPYTEEYAEDIFVGYRWYDAAKIQPKYPFGYGLSYTEFEYSDLSADKNGVTFTVKNIGNVPGAEVAQVYISYPDIGLPCPVRALKGFKKVFLNAGESVKVSVPFNGKTFRLYNDKEHKFCTFGGTYAVTICPSSRDVRLETCVQIQGDKAVECTQTAEDIIKRAACMQAEGENLPKKPCVTVTLQSPFADLRRAKGWAGRLLFKVADFYCNSKNTPALLTLRYLTLRSVAQYARFNGAQSDGLLLVCNGRFFKGLKKIIFKK